MSFLKKIEKYDLELHGVRLPSFEIDVADKRAISVSEDITNDKFLVELCKNSLKKHNIDKKEYRDRLNYEYKTFLAKKINRANKCDSS